MDFYKDELGGLKMKRKYFIFLVIVAFVTFLYAPIVLADSILTVLGDAQTFAVTGAAGVTNPATDNTLVVGNLGVSPSSSVTGFLTVDGGAGTVTSGTIHLNDGPGVGTAKNAQAAVLKATTALGNLGTGYLLPVTPLGTNTLGSLGTVDNLTPGVYTFATAAALHGTLTLKAGGDPNAVFVFLIPTALNTDANSSVVIDPGGAGGGQDAGVFWVTGTAATLGDNSSFEGNILAGSAITLDPGAQIVCGRALAQTAVTFAGVSPVPLNNLVNCVDCGVSPETLGLSGGLEFTGPDTFELKLISGGNGGGVPVPEPATMLLLGSGLVGLAGLARRKFKK